MTDLAKRLPTTLVLIVFVYVVIRFVPASYFAVVVFLISSMAVYEFVRLANPALCSYPLIFGSGLLVGLAFLVPAFPLLLSIFSILLLNGLFFLFSIRRPENLGGFVRDLGIHLLTVFYLYIPLFFIYELKKMGAHFLFFLIAVIAVGDTGAYFVGSQIGKHKIYPIASPKKSLEGLLAAVVTAALSGWLAILVFPLPIRPPTAMVTAALIGLFSQLSDPVESLFKRAAGKKDSGGILPGHGGILDRLDSYVFCAPILFYIATYIW